MRREETKKMKAEVEKAIAEMKSARDRLVKVCGEIGDRADKEDGGENWSGAMFDRAEFKVIEYTKAINNLTRANNSAFGGLFHLTTSVTDEFDTHIIKY